MDHARRLAESPTDPDRGSCLGCAVPYGPLPPQTIHQFEGRAFVRCSHCGERNADSPLWEALCDCAECGAPQLLQPEQAPSCVSCGEPSTWTEQEISAISAAIEGEWLTGLSGDWEFISSDSAQRYLERLRCTIVQAAPTLPSTGRVLIVRNSSLRSLALPGGSICLSTGLLGSVADEAELVFLLAHELAHAASGDCRRHALRGLASSGDAAERRRGWLACAEDLMRLGHGDRLEFDADRQALWVTRELGYDGLAPLRWLRRIGQRMDTDDPELGELALAHPPVHARTSRLESERNLQATGEGPATVCNREVFRRLLGHTALESDLHPLRSAALRRGRVGAGPRWAKRAFAGFLIVAAVALLWWLLTAIGFKLG